MSSKLQLDACHHKQVVAPSGERLRGKGRYAVQYAGKTVQFRPI